MLDGPAEIHQQAIDFSKDMDRKEFWEEPEVELSFLKALPQVSKITTGGWKLRCLLRNGMWPSTTWVAGMSVASFRVL